VRADSGGSLPPQVRVFFPDSGEASIALNGIGMNPVSGQWNQEPTFHNWPGPVDYLLRDDLLTQTVNKSYGYVACQAAAPVIRQQDDADVCE